MRTARRYDGLQPAEGKVTAPGSVCNLRPRQLRSVLEVILKNLRGQSGRNLFSGRLHGADDFSTANHFGGREPGNLGRQYQINFQRYIRLQEFLRLKQQAGAADVSGFPVVPVLFVETAIFQG